MKWSILTLPTSISAQIYRLQVMKYALHHICKGKTNIVITATDTPGKFKVKFPYFTQSFTSMYTI